MTLTGGAMIATEGKAKEAATLAKARKGAKEAAVEAVEVVEVVEVVEAVEVGLQRRCFTSSCSSLVARRARCPSALQ